jgi:hypothetical protein
MLIPTWSNRARNPLTEGKTSHQAGAVAKTLPQPIPALLHEWSHLRVQRNKTMTRPR